MKIKDTKLYTVHCYWVGEDDTQPMYRTVCVGRPDFLDDVLSEDWTKEQEHFDFQIFYYYDDYHELEQHLKDGHETVHSFIVTKIISI